MIVTAVPGGCGVSVQDWRSAPDQSPGLCLNLPGEHVIICFKALFDEK